MSESQVIFGAGHVHITLKKDARGNKIDPPTPLPIPAVQNISADFGKADVKMMYGQKEFAIHAAQGKKTTEVSFECGEIYAQMLNDLYFGQSTTAGSQKIYRDSTGHELRANYQVAVRIKNVITLNISKSVAYGSATIGSQGVTRITNASAVLLNGQIRVTNGKYEFAAGDVGKSISITHNVLDKTTQGSATGTTVISTFSIPATLQFDFNDFTNAIGISNSGLTRDKYSPDSFIASDHYQYSHNGTLVFNSSQLTNSLANKNVNHITNGIRVTTVIPTLPSAGYVMIIDPPASALFTNDLGVVLKTGTIAGLSEDDSLVKSATPTTGQYDADTAGLYTFAAADAGAVVTIRYITDFIFTSVTPPDGYFLSNKGVRNADAMPLTRVALTNPLALLPNQYALDEAGNYYFDGLHAGEKVYIDFEYASSTGVTLAIKNNDMGSTPTVEIDLSGFAEGQNWRINYPRAVPKAYGFATKLDDYAMYKVTYEVIADKVSNEVGKVYLQS